MSNSNDFFAYIGAAPAAKKTSTAPSRRNLNAIRQKVVIEYNKPITHTVTDVNPFPDAVNILSDEFLNGTIRTASRNTAPKPIQPPAAPKMEMVSVIMPEQNTPRKTALIDSQATRVYNPLELVRYSDASFAIFGTTDPAATKKYKDDLQSLGGKFNKWLKKDGQPTPGYIYPMWRLDSVKKYMERF